MNAPACSALLALLAVGVAGCMSSHSLDPSARAAPTAPESVSWRAATRGDVVGFYESERITGEAAASVRHLAYDFAPDGAYSGAALVQGAGGRQFQTLAGRWALDGATLRLGDDPPVKVFAAEGRLRLDSEGGSVVLRRAKDE